MQSSIRKLEESVKNLLDKEAAKGTALAANSEGTQVDYAIDILFKLLQPSSNYP
jgi:hypothetical protein